MILQSFIITWSSVIYKSIMLTNNLLITIVVLFGAQFDFGIMNVCKNERVKAKRNFLKSFRGFTKLK